MRLQSRRNSRGAAFTEALILIPILILLDVSLMYMTSVYRTKLYTMRQVRTEAWNQANVGCPAPPTPTPETMYNNVSPDMSLGAVAGDVAVAQKNATQPKLQKEMNDLRLPQLSATTRRRATDQHYYTALEYASRNIVFCNEVPVEVEGEYFPEVNDFYGKYVR